MAAIDLELGLEHSGRGWGQERPELMDNFDLEMQEWEDQLQDIQRKIEEVRRCSVVSENKDVCVCVCVFLKRLALCFIYKTAHSDRSNIYLQASHTHMLHIHGFVPW